MISALEKCMYMNKNKKNKNDFYFVNISINGVIKMS